MKLVKFAFLTGDQVLTLHWQRLSGENHIRLFQQITLKKQFLVSRYWHRPKTFWRWGRRSCRRGSKFRRGHCRSRCKRRRARCSCQRGWRRNKTRRQWNLLTIFAWSIVLNASVVSIGLVLMVPTLEGGEPLSDKKQTIFFCKSRDLKKYKKYVFFCYFIYFV